VAASTKLATLEAKIKVALHVGEKGYRDAGKLLDQIRTLKLYEAAGYPTFSAYLEKKGWSRGHAYRLIDAALYAEARLQVGDTPPANESQARKEIDLTGMSAAAFRKLPAEDRREVIKSTEAKVHAQAQGAGEVAAIAAGLRKLKQAKALFGKALPATEAVLDKLDALIEETEALRESEACV
jgi:hypothetical protein